MVWTLYQWKCTHVSNGSSFIHLPCCSQDLSKLPLIAVVPFLSLFYSISLYKYTTIYLSMLIEHWIVSTLGLSQIMLLGIFLFFFLRFYLLIFRKKGKKKEERNMMCERNRLPLSHTQLGTWPKTQACALTGNWTDNLWVHRLVLNPLRHTSQGWEHSCTHLNDT